MDDEAYKIFCQHEGSQGPHLCKGRYSASILGSDNWRYGLRCG